MSEFLADLSIMDEEPQYADGKPLEHGIGLLVFKHDRPEIAAYTNGWFPLRGKNYDALWDQVRHGAYARCDIDKWLSPLVSEPPNLVWDVDRPVFITAASVRFARPPYKSRQPNHVVEGDYSVAARHSLPQRATMTREEDRTKKSLAKTAKALVLPCRSRCSPAPTR